MRRSISHQHLTWADKTMSALRGQDQEDAEKRLETLPSVGLFDVEDDGPAEVLWAASYEADSRTLTTGIHTVEGMREAVIERLPTEMALLSPGEIRLLNRLYRNGGREKLDFGDFLAAESLVRRLWATPVREKDSWSLTLPLSLLFPMRFIQANEELQRFRQMMGVYAATLTYHLTKYGMVPEQDALRFLLRDTAYEGDFPLETLFRWWIENTFDYIVVRGGQRILIHPGLAEAEPLLAVRAWDHPVEALPDELTEEDPEDVLTFADPDLCDEGLSLLEGSTRPETSPALVISDLIALARQGVSEPDMRAALASALMIVPTPEMERLIHRIVQTIPRWVGQSAGQVM